MEIGTGNSGQYISERVILIIEIREAQARVTSFRVHGTEVPWNIVVKLSK